MAVLVGTGASDSNQSNIANFKATADSMIEATQEALDELARNIYLPRYGVATGELGTYQQTYNTPLDKAEYTESISFPTFTAPIFDYSDIDPTISLGPKPINTAEKLAFNEPTKPMDTQITQPGDVPQISNPTLPDVPVLSEIPSASKYRIDIPDKPVILEHEFTSIPPDSSGLVVPGNTFSWAEVDYSSPILTEIQAQISAFLAGSVGIPDSVWDAIWDREVEREDKTTAKFIQEITEEWGARGWTMPQGIQDARITEARQANQSARNTIGRDIAEKQAQHEIENLKFAVQQGAVLENMLGGWYQQKTARLFDAAKFTFNATVELFNSSLALYNAELQGYITDSQVFKTLIESEMVKLQQYKTELESQALISSINQQEINYYLAQYEGLKIQVDLYNSQLDGVKSQIEIDRIKMLAYSEEVKAYGSLVNANAQKYDNYISLYKAEEIKKGLYSSDISAFSEEMKAYKTDSDIEVDHLTQEFKAADLIVKEMSAKLAIFNTDLEGAITEVEGRTKEFNANNQTYLNDVKNEQLRVDIATKVRALNQEYAQLGNQVNIETARLNIASSKAEAALGVDAARTIGTLNSQLGSAIYTALNIGNNISDRAVETLSKSE